MISVLEHLSDPLAVLKECHRLLQPRGLLVVNVPTWRGKTFLEFSAFTLGLSPSEEMNDHKRYYDLPDLWPLFIAAGWTPCQVIMRRYKWGLNLFATAAKSPARER
jgi:SAM-dependent methyltransferase